MLYVLTYDNRVLNGPRGWNYRSFESTLQDECNITYKLPVDYNEPGSLKISSNVTIYSAQEDKNVDHNPKIEYLHGPFWNFDTGVALGTYQVVSHPVDAVQSTLKQVVANHRYNNEISGIKVTVQNTSIQIATTRGDREKWTLWANQGIDNLKHKFNGVWLTLSNDDIKTIANAIHGHVQTHFEWEANKHEEIDACDTLEKLNAVELVK